MKLIKNNMKYKLFLMFKIKIISYSNIFYFKKWKIYYVEQYSWLKYLNFINKFFILCYLIIKIIYISYINIIL